MKSKIKRNIFWIILLAAAVSFFGYKIILTIKEKNEYKAQLTVATEYAVEYIRDKYGFEPEFIKESGTEFDRKNFNIMYLDFRYNSKDFMVIFRRLNDNTDCADDYQSKEIEQAIADKILSEYPDGKLISSSVAYKIQLYPHLFANFGFQTYYDGSNLDEVLTGCNGKIEMVFADTEFSDTGIVDLLTERNIDVEFTSFDTAERLEEFETASSVISPYYQYKKFAPYITDHLEIKDGVKKHGLNISFQSCGDFIYAYFPTENKGFPVSREITVEEQHPEAIAQYYKKYDEGEYVSKPITNAYVFEYGWGTYIYYPLEKLKDYDIENIGAAWYWDSGQSGNRGIEKLSVYGDYAVIHLPYGSRYFMLVDTSGYDEYIPSFTKKI